MRLAVLANGWGTRQFYLIAGRWQDTSVSLIEMIGELGTLDPWLYRGWLYLLSSRYRSARHDAWKNSGILYAAADIALSVVIMGAEIVAVTQIAYGVVGVVRGST
jgi:hypothetical protein